MKIKNIPKLWNARKAVFRGKFIAVNDYIKKGKRSQIGNLTFHLKVLEKEEQIYLKQGKK